MIRPFNEDLTLFGRLWDRVVLGRRGHRTLGPLTLFEFGCAMYGTVELSTRWGVLCVAWPWWGRRWAALGLGPWLYLSPNCTPWAATLLLGWRWTRAERRLARVRRILWGHGYDAERHDAIALRDALETA